MTQVPKSFREFAMGCKAAQRAYIRKERERIERAEALWDRYTRDFAELGLYPMTGADISSRRAEIEMMTAEIDEKYGDNEAMRASYAMYLKSLDQG